MVILSLLTDTSLKDLVINFIMFALYAPLIKNHPNNNQRKSKAFQLTLIKQTSRLTMTARIRLTD